MGQQLRVGIVGCGEVTQILHLPALTQLPHLFAVTALCDLSRAVLDGVGDRWGIAARSTDLAALLARTDVDAVLVANPHVFHAETAIAAMRAGKHVLVEKPSALSLAEADAMLAAERDSGVVVQVGYMRRHAPALLEAKALVAALPEIRLARVHDVIGRNALVIRDTSDVVRATDLSPDALLARQRAGVEAAIGAADDDLATAYLMLLGLASHDISAMRELLGRAPGRVLYATHRREGRMVTAALDYGDFVAQVEIGSDAVPRMDAHLEVYGMHRTIRVEYDTPYVRNLPARLVVTDAKDEVGLSAITSFPTRADTFGLEWRDFHANVTQRRAPRTGLADARQDLALFAEMVRHMRG